MTTVGYGDISPETGLGRVVSSICAICGVLLLAVTLPMFVNNFLTLYQYSCVNESIEKWRNVKQMTTRACGGKQSGEVKVNDETDKNLKVSSHFPDGMDRPPSYTTAIKTGSTVQEVKIYHVKEAEIKQPME
jgi:hypothetical protein